MQDHDLEHGKHRDHRGGNRRALRGLRWVCGLLMVIGSMLASGGTIAQSTAPTAETASAEAKLASPNPEDLRALADLLAKPEIQAWLRDPRTVLQEGARAGPTLHEAVSGQVDAARQELQELAKAAPDMPRELAEARRTLMEELRRRPVLAILIPVLIFAVLGAGCEWLYWRFSGGLRERIRRRWAETPAARLRGVTYRLLYGTGAVLAFAVGSIGVFLMFNWTPLLQDLVVAYLMVFLGARWAHILGRVVLSRGDERYRLLPMSTPAAAYWLRWWTIVVGVFLLGKFTLDQLPALHMREVSQHLIEIGFGLVQLTVSLVALWRAPTFDGIGKVWRRHPAPIWLITIFCFALWLSSFAGSGTLFHAGLVLLTFGFAIRGVRLAVDHVFRPAEDSPASTPGTKSRPVIAVALERGLCAVLLIIGATMIASIIGLNFNNLAAGETWAMRLGRGALNAAVILLVADCLWQVAKAWIERKLADATSMARVYGEEARRRARVRTLLPVVRNIFAVILVVLAGLMALAALGVDIGPLIAGAGVVGVAIGFGAQTLVKDIISGMFFLFDDAFRAGEYIESGNISGTVEAFSVRSVKLRHALGALHTIPLGTLNTITNYSRDWVIDQMMVNVTYDADLDKVKKITAEIGQRLMEDPAFEPFIIEPLKLQGVEAFGDYFIKICLKMMTKPGEQHAIRRKAFVMLKKAFDENGISFAFPTVKVEGGEAESGAARKGLDMMQQRQAPA
jgi:small-conductance mechanosensitive channel